MRVAAVTMVWNEAVFLPMWLRHYGAQLGAENCFVIDHGSDDGSTAVLAPPGDGGPSLIRLPRTPLDEEKRAAFVSRVASGLLSFYDVVIYTDSDELLVADPLHHAGLRDFCASMDTDVVTAIGLNVQHAPDREADFDPDRPVSAQRAWVRFVSPMCKPSVIRRPVVWQPGFHSADCEIRFGRLFSFHLRFFDMKLGLARLAKTRDMQRAFPWTNPHQAIPDQQFVNDLIYGVGHAESREDVSLEPDQPPLRCWLERIEREQHARSGEMYRIDLELIEPAFWRLPDRFVGSF